MQAVVVTATTLMSSTIRDLHSLSQNDEELHERAGNERVIHLHGRLLTPRCSDCGQLHALPSAVPHEPVDPCPVDPPSDLFYAVGTSGLLCPAAELPHVAHLAGGVVVRVNPDLNGPEDFSTIDLVGKAGEILPAMIESLDRASQSSNG